MTLVKSFGRHKNDYLDFLCNCPCGKDVGRVRANDTTTHSMGLPGKRYKPKMDKRWCTSPFSYHSIKKPGVPHRAARLTVAHVLLH